LTKALKHTIITPSFSSLTLSHSRNNTHKPFSSSSSSKTQKTLLLLLPSFRSSKVNASSSSFLHPLQNPLVFHHARVAPPSLITASDSLFIAPVSLSEASPPFTWNLCENCEIESEKRILHQTKLRQWLINDSLYFACYRYIDE